MVRMRRNCHHLSTIKYHETTEKTARMAKTNCVSRLDVSTNSHGVVGIAPRTCSSSIRFPPLPLGSLADAPMPLPGALQDFLETRVLRPPSEYRGRALHSRDQRGRIAGPARALDGWNRAAGDPSRDFDNLAHRLTRSRPKVHRDGRSAVEGHVERAHVR